MSGGIFEDAENASDSDKSEPSERPTGPSNTKQKFKKKKTKTKRGATDKDLLLKKNEKKIKHDLSNIPVLLKEIAKENATKAERRQSKRRRAQMEKINLDNQPFMLGEELTCSLRTLKPQSDLFADHFRSYQTRGIFARSFTNPRTRKERKRFKGIEKK